MQQLPLRDIHLPDAVSWWPLAPGWWLLLALIIALYFFIPWLIKRIKRKPLNKIALIEFKKIELAYQENKDNTQVVRDISALLRRIGMSYTSRNNSASLTGEAWLQQLNTLSTDSHFSEELGQQIISAPYQSHSDAPVDELLIACKNWIQSLPKRYAS